MVCLSVHSLVFMFKIWLVIFDIKALNRFSTIVVHCKRSCKSFNIKSKISSEAVHSIFLISFFAKRLLTLHWHFWFLFFLFRRYVKKLFTVLHLVKSIGKPSLWVSTKFISVLCLHDFPWDSLRRSNISLVLFKDTLQLLSLIHIWRCRRAI